MKRLEIFKAGKQTSASGEEISFSEDALRASVEAYDPAKHEAPIVVGHPKDNAPAYGWIRSMEYSEDGTLHAEADQVHEEFAELVKAGRFKKRSASFYKPDSPSNPVPGTYYLRHVGFLGAAPPAVKGLADAEFQEGRVPDAVEFSDSADDVIEFADTGTMATLFSRFREFLIDKFGSEEADKVAPKFLIEDLEDEARRERDSGEGENFREPTPSHKQSGEHTMAYTEQQLRDLEAKANQADTLQSELDSLKDKETDFAERERKLARAEIEKSVDGLIDEGRILPAERENEINYLESLDAENQDAVEFSEGEGKDKKTQKLSQRAAYLDRLQKRPPIVDFKERAGEQSEDDTEDYHEVVDDAITYREQQAQKGRHITATQAVREVKAGKHKQQ